MLTLQIQDIQHTQILRKIAIIICYLFLTKVTWLTLERQAVSRTYYCNSGVTTERMTSYESDMSSLSFSDENNLLHFSQNQRILKILTRQSLGEFLFHLFRFFFLFPFCLLLLLTSFYFDQTFHKSFQLGLAWFSLTQLGSA